MICMRTYLLVYFDVPHGGNDDDLRAAEQVEEGVLEPGGALLDVDDVEGEYPRHHQVVDELCEGAPLVVDAPAEIRSLRKVF